MILDKFYTNKFDEDIVLISHRREVTFKELKSLVYFQMKNFLLEEECSVVLFCDDCYEFVVNFFAAIFANKKIFLLTDKNRLKNIELKYFLPKSFDNCSPEVDVNFDKVNPETVSINFYTSGSTGIPKVITKNFSNLENEAKAIVNQFEFNKNLEVYSTTIMTHMFGMTFHFMLPMYAGLIINSEKIEFPEQLTEDKPYILVSSPSFLEKMTKYEVDFEYAPMRIITAGDKLKNNVKNFFSRKSDIIEIYGSTETGVIAYKNNTDFFKVFDVVRVSTCDDGCILVKSDFFMEEQIKMEDVIEKISEREFELKGRNDRIVKIKEKRISLAEIENLLKNFETVIDAYCFKYEDVLACVIVTKDSTLEEKSLKEYLSNYSEIVPKKWRFLDEIPRLETGKVNKKYIEHIFGLNLTYPFVVERRYSSGCVEIDMIFKRKSNFFNGHFPVMPILPGVVQLFFANWFAKEAFNIDISKKEAKRIKFSNIIKSNQIVTLKLRDNKTSIEFTYVANDVSYSSGIFVL